MSLYDTCKIITLRQQLDATGRKTVDKNITLDVVYQDESGQYRETSIALAPYLSVIDGTFRWDSSSSQPIDRSFLRLTWAGNAVLLDGWFQRSNGDYGPSQIKLDDFVRNDKGKLVVKNSGSSPSHHDTVHVIFLPSSSIYIV